jgi:hypothetical protein
MVAGMNKADGMSFEDWKRELNRHFNSAFGLGMDDFPDYNWFDEWDNDCDPEDSFYEWKCMTDAGIIG